MMVYSFSTDYLIRDAIDSFVISLISDTYTADQKENLQVYGNTLSSFRKPKKDML